MSINYVAKNAARTLAVSQNDKARTEQGQALMIDAEHCMSGGGYAVKFAARQLTNHHEMGIDLTGVKLIF